MPPTVVVRVWRSGRAEAEGRATRQRARSHARAHPMSRSTGYRCASGHESPITPTRTTWPCCRSCGEVEVELPWYSGPRARWRPRPEADVGEDPRDVVSRVGDFDEAHPPAATRAGHHVDGEDTLQQVRPGVPRAGRRCGLEHDWHRLAVERQSQLHWLGLLGLLRRRV